MLRVVKLGGSLLAWPNTPNRLKEWLRRQSAAKTVLLAGGGELVDVVRGWDTRFCLGADVSHKLALDCMSLTGKLVASWLPDADEVQKLEQVRESRSSTIILDARNWVLGSSQLPATWELTSDSIAAAVASELSAGELVLLKSCLPADSELEYYDPLFSQFVATRNVRFVSLRSMDFDEVPFGID